MEFIRGLHNLNHHQRGCVLTVGNFDGVHLGHQAIIAQLAEVSRETRLPAVALTFEPHPREFFNPAQVPARLTRWREKIHALQATALDRVLCLAFNRSFASLTPRYFIDHLLVQRLGIKAIVVGDDFRFGHQGAGDLALLKTIGAEVGFKVISCARFELEGRRVSSSWVRETLAAGDLAMTQALLGRPYTIHGRVAYGDQLGRTLGFPTANVPLGRRATPVSGVFAVQVQGLDKQPLTGVANVGKRPTVNGSQTRLEVHLFDFDADIYGHLIQVELAHKLRDEQRFAGLDALKQQIQRDAEQARDYFHQTKLTLNQ